MARFTPASVTPSTLRRLFSTRLAQAAQVIPPMSSENDPTGVGASAMSLSIREKSQDGAAPASHERRPGSIGRPQLIVRRFDAVAALRGNVSVSTPFSNFAPARASSSSAGSAKVRATEP